MSELRAILRALHDAGAHVVVVGGVALQLHGSSYITADIDFAFERTRDNAERIATALRPFSPRPRAFPPDVPFTFDARTLMATEILTLETSAGDIDLLGTIAGLGSYPVVDAAAETMEFDGFSIRVLTVEGLIKAKRAAGRPKDAAGLVELELLQEAIELAGERDAGARDAT